jgi:hypothetical protein
MANLFNRYESESYPGQWHCVCADDVDRNDCYGWGRTIEEAHEVWGVIVLEHVDDHIHDMMTSGQITPEVAEACWTAIDSPYGEIYQ